MTTFDSLRPYLTRYLGIALAWLAGRLVVKYGITIPSEALQQFAEAIVDVVGIMLTAYATTHKTGNKYVNPSDTASKHLAVAGKEHREAIRRAEDKIPR